MNLFLIRHAEAADGLDDAARPLTAHGIAQAHTLAHQLDRAAFAGVRTIEHTSYARARQTAELFRSAAGLENLPLAEHDEFLPNANPRITAGTLADAPADRLIIAHNPHLELLISLLLGQERIGVQLAIPPATAVALERFADKSPRYPYGYWQLHWLIPTPKNKTPNLEL
jgi:phosphohistidine phosphatase